jgi:hypothetical protein
VIIVKVELHSARTGKVTEIGRMCISNVGSGSDTRADYYIELMRRGTTNKAQRLGHVSDYPRKSYSVWELVRRALSSVLDKHPVPSDSTSP